MILSDKSIKQEVKGKNLLIKPFKKENVQPSSYDVRLATKFRVFKNLHQPYIDIKNKSLDTVSELITANEKDGLIIHPGEFILGSTMEYLEIPNNLVAELQGRSSLGRIGLVIHSMSGYIDPGFKGHITFHITNLSNTPIKIYPKFRVAQLVFYKMTTPAEIPYGDSRLNSKYQNQTDPTASRLFKDFESKEGK